MYDWNKSSATRVFWSHEEDEGRGREVSCRQSNKQVINNPNGIKFESGLMVLMEVTSELIDTVETGSNLITDEWGRIEGEML